MQTRIDASGLVYWNREQKSLAELRALLRVEGARGLSGSGTVDPSRQPTIEIGADANAEYDVLAKVLSRVKNANLAKVSFN